MSAQGSSTVHFEGRTEGAIVTSPRSDDNSRQKRGSHYGEPAICAANERDAIVGPVYGSITRSTH
ncbi:MAG: hypothetical protein AMXMBFR4_27540 [Candidatus Hydrogenedentota bacterium]